MVFGKSGGSLVFERFTPAQGRVLLEGPSPRKSAAPPRGAAMTDLTNASPIAHGYPPEVKSAFLALESSMLRGQDLIVAMKLAASFGTASVLAAIDITTTCSNPLPAFVAARVIGYVDNPEAVNSLVDALVGRDIQVCVGAARALALLPDPRIDIALERAVLDTPKSSYTWDLLRSVMAHRRLPDLYRRDPASVSDADVFDVFRFWWDQCRLDPMRLAAIAQPFEHLNNLEALERDALTDTIWRVICTSRLQRTEGARS